MLCARAFVKHEWFGLGRNQATRNGDCGYQLSQMYLTKQGENPYIKTTPTIDRNA